MALWVKSRSPTPVRFFEQTTAPTTLEGITLGDLWVDTSSTPVLKICTSISPITYSTVGGGGGSYAPTDAQYVVLASNGTLSNETVLAAGSSKIGLTGATIDVNETNLTIASSQVTGTKTSSYISDFNEAAQDAVSNILIDSSRIDFTYDDALNTVTADIKNASVTNAMLVNSAVANLSGTNTGDQTNISGNAATVTTNANLTGHITSTGNAAILGSFTLAQLNTAISNADVASGGGTATGTNTGDQTIILTSDVTGSGVGSFATTIANNVVTLAKMATMTTTSLLGRSTAGTGNVEVLSSSTAKTLLDLLSQTEIDFGSTPVADGIFTITDANCSATSQIIAFLAYEAPTNKDLDECEMDQLNIVCGPGSGQFTMYVNADDGSYLADKFKINYILG